MKKYKISDESLNKPLNFSFMNMESTIIPIDIDGEKKVLKVFNENHNYLDTKWKIIESFERLNEYFDERFILPEMIATTDKNIGYIMRFVKNINLENLLNDYNVSFKVKINCLKEICLLLEECKKIRSQSGDLSNFYIGDLHVNNFLFNVETRHLNICDMDSCSIGYSEPQCYRYLSCSHGLNNLSDKYPCVDGKFIPNENSDLYCAIMLIMNYLYNGPIEMMNREEFYKYINYLDSLEDRGVKLFDKELLTAFSKVYDKDDNVNPEGYLDTLSEKVLTRTNSVSYYYSKFKLY